MTHPKGTYGQLRDDLEAAKDDLVKRLRLVADYGATMCGVECNLLREAADKIEELENQIGSMSYDLRE